MFISNDHAYIQSSLLARESALTHAYSLRNAGDMRRSDARRAFLKRLHLDPDRLVMANQVHGSRVEVIDGAHANRVSEADALVVDRREGVSIGVIVADCVPFLLLDTKKHIFAVAHAGWKGTIAGIAKKTLQTMIDLGSSAADIRVSMGPHIGMCCYSVSEDRAKLFLNEYQKDERVASKMDDGWHLDIGYVNRLELLGSGITASQIDSPPVCTSCQNDRFFSFRKDSESTFGEILAVMAVQ